MAVRGLKETSQRLNKLIGEISGPKAEKAITEVLIVGAGAAALMTPIDTSNLINSQYRIVRQVGFTVRGMVGYTAKYAAAVHDKLGTGKGKPRDPGDPSRGNMWDPDAEPEFLRKGFEEHLADIERVIKRNMQV